MQEMQVCNALLASLSNYMRYFLDLGTYNGDSTDEDVRGLCVVANNLGDEVRCEADDGDERACLDGTGDEEGCP